MLATCGNCGNYVDDDRDGVGFCNMCKVFVLKDSKCDIMPVNLQQTLNKVAKRLNLNSIESAVKSNYGQADFSNEGKNVN